MDAPASDSAGSGSDPSPTDGDGAAQRQKMHGDEVDIDTDLVVRLVASQFPAWAGLPVEEVPSAGTVNGIYRLGPDLIIRLPRSHTYATDVEDDLKVLVPLAGRLPLEIPTILAIGRPGEGYPFRWGVYRWIDGTSWSARPPEDLYQAAEDLAGFVRSLQALDPSGARRGYRGGRLAAIDEIVRGAIAGSSELVPADAVTRAWEVSLAVPERSGPPVWFHGDLLPTNLVVADGRLRGVIDFGCCGIGNPAVEYSTAWSLFPAEVRLIYRQALAVDEDTWIRARGWAILRGVMGYDYYRTTNPEFAANAWHSLQEVLAEIETEG